MSEIPLFLENEVYFTLIMTLIVASAFPLGALLSYYAKPPSRLKGDIPAYSAGIFFSAIAFILIDESILVGSFTTMVVGFIAGALVFSLTHRALKTGLLNSKIQNIGVSETIGSSRSDNNDDTSYNRINKVNQSHNKNNNEQPNLSNVIMIGKLMDSLPKALFIGFVIALDLRGLLPAVIALFLGNFTATFEGARRMKEEEGKSLLEIVRKWMYVFAMVAIAGPVGYYLAKPLPNEYLSIMIGFAAGGLIAFITEDLIPESQKKAKWHIGLSTAFGFLTGMVLFHFLR
jgi:ZIP family zinc transporter